MITVITQTIQFEIKLYLKSRNFWLAASLINAYAWIAFLLAGQVMSGAAQMFIPALLFVTAEGIIKDKRENFTEIMYVLPYHNGFLLSGRALAVLLWFILLGMELLLTMLIATCIGLPVHLSSSACWAFMVKYLVSCINVIGITFLASSLTKKTIPFYSILLFWWLIGIFLTGNVGTLFPQWVSIANFTFIHGFGGNPSEVAGVYPNDGLIIAIIGFQIICSILLFTLGVAIENARRDSNGMILKACLFEVLTGIIMILATFFATWQYFDLQNISYKQPTSISDIELPRVVNSSIHPNLSIAAYDLYIVLDSKNHNLMAQAQVTMKDLGSLLPSTVEFTLRDYFRVQQVINVATGERLTWQQQGSYLTVSLPPDSFTDAGLLTIEITYSGMVWEQSEDFYGQGTGLINFVSSPFTCLRGGFAWYPILGRQTLYTITSYSLPWTQQKKQLIEHLLVSHIPVPFKMTVDSDETITLISNIELVEKIRNGNIERHKFNSPAGRDVFLLAGPYEHTKIMVAGTEKLVDFYHFPNHQQNLNHMAYKVRQIDYYNSLVPRNIQTSAFGDLEKGYLIFESPRFLTYDNLMNTSNLGFVDAIAIPEAIFLTKSLGSPWWSQSAGRVLSEARSLNLWWPNCFSKTKGDIADGLALYMYIRYLENEHGKKIYDNAREYWLAYNDESPDNEMMLEQRGWVIREIFLLLDRIRQSNLGDDGVNQFLRIINTSYQNKRMINVTDIVTALELIGALPNHDNPRKISPVTVINYRNSINTLEHLLANPLENKRRSTLALKLTWDFGTQIKVKAAQ
ncbi:ABC transporter permease [Pelosinus sp. sgz500959]|uniref:ABC transporter permease n=1 Tax=Pelosinus sp. sgz500959 TaxID=3242472 RepID=UPI00366AEBB3